MEKRVKTRESAGKIASIVGILLNICLSVGKIVIGLVFGFISVLADGLNNLSDSGSSVVSLISFKLSSKPADKKHPYGHERIEYISSMIVAFVILIIAFELAKESVAKIVAPEALDFSFLVVAVLVVSILVKLFMYVYYMRLAKKIDSDILKATAIDSASDCISTSAVLVSVVIGKIFNINIDGYISILVAILVAWSGIKILKESSSKLIGQAPDKQLIDEIKTRILAHDEVLGFHDLNVYCYGPNKYFASVHIELDANIDVLISHEIVDDIEREFAAETNILLTGHLDPIVINDEEVNFMRGEVDKIVKSVDESYSMHDFRMVKGPHKTNIIFDVAVPIESLVDEQSFREKIETEVKKIDPKYNLVMIVEKQLF